MLEHEQTAQQVARDVVVAEAKSEHWVTSAWRPIVMLMFAVMIANNYIIAPYLDAIFGTSIMFDLPDQAWSLLSVGLGGYVVGRSAEGGRRTSQKRPKLSRSYLTFSKEASYEAIWAEGNH